MDNNLVKDILVKGMENFRIKCNDIEIIGSSIITEEQGTVQRFLCTYKDLLNKEGRVIVELTFSKDNKLESVRFKKEGGIFGKMENKTLKQFMMEVKLRKR